MTTTFRQDVVTGLVAIIDSFIAANPTMLRRSEAAQPPSPMGDLPLAYIDVESEAITHDSGLRQRVMVVSIVVVRPMADNVETVLAEGVFVDAFLDHLSANPHVMPLTSPTAPRGDIWDRMTIEREDYPVASDDGTVRHFYATRFRVGNLSIQEGRV